MKQMTHALDSIKGLILEYLKEEKTFKFGGTIEDHIRAIAGPKASNVSRRLRELHQEGLIERRLVQVKVERGNKLVVQYKWKDLTRSYPQPSTPIKSGDEVVNEPSLF